VPGLRPVTSFEEINAKNKIIVLVSVHIVVFTVTPEIS
jgi:hypothetical protein